jgi:hypothetical protein
MYFDSVNQVIHGAGKHAEWANLTWSFVVEELDFLRSTAWSNQVSIGFVSIPSNELAEAPANSLGFCEVCYSNILLRVVIIFLALALIFPQVYRDLITDSGSISGKLRVVFMKQSFREAEIPLSKSIVSLHIDPPMLVTVYNISVFDLRAAHMFGQNYPVVRGECGMRRWSTHV